MTAPIIPIYTAIVPNDGLKTFRQPLEPYAWASIPDAPIIDASLMVAQSHNKMCEIQGVFIDNRFNNQNYLFTCLDSMQRVLVVHNTAGYYPLLCGDVPKFRLTQTTGPNETIESESGEIFKQINFHFYNMYIDPFIWRMPVTDNDNLLLIDEYNFLLSSPGSNFIKLS